MSRYSGGASTLTRVKSKLKLAAVTVRYWVICPKLACNLLKPRSPDMLRIENHLF